MSLSVSEVFEPQGRRDTVVGMRREWNFSLTFVHQAARVVMQLSPQWESTFIDPRDFEQLNRLDRDVKHCPMMPALQYTDLSAVMKPNNELWTEIPKRVSIMYSHIPPDMTLAAYCVRSVQHVLSDPHVVSVDGCTDLLHLRVGDKLRCPHRLGGQRSFQFRYHVSVKSQLMKDAVYAIGTIINQRGYLCTVRCGEEEELEGYVAKNFLPQYTNPDKFAVDQDVAYEEMSSTVLKEQQELFGELRYFDADASVAFSIPMHPMRIRPDFSPTQTVGVGSVACMTLELDVHQKLIDDFAEAEITGMPKYKINPVILFLDVEDVARMGYPRIMSTEQYSHLKTKRLLDIFADAKLVGTPVTNHMGIRTGRSRTVTLTYEPLSTVVKVMTVSTLVGSLGVSAVFLTKLGGGLFDAHLYLYQQLLEGIKFCERTAAKTLFSRFRTVNVRLLEQSLPRAYSSAPADERQAMERHLKFLRESSDGRVEGAVAIPVPAEDGGLEKRHRQHKRRLSPHYRRQMHSPHSTVNDSVSGQHSVGSNSSQMVVFRGSESGGERKFSDLVYEEDEETSNDEEGASTSILGLSYHSASDISVTSIAHLQGMAPDDSFVDGEAGGSPPRRPNAAVAASPNESVELGAERATAAASLAQAPAPHGSQEPSSPMLTEVAEGETLCPSSATTTVERLAVGPSSTTSAAQDGAEGGAAETSQPNLQQQQQQEEDRDEEQRHQQQLREVLKDNEADVYFGPSLHDIYVRSCDMQRCKPNSYLLKKLPTDPRFTNGVRELDLSSNYLGRGGFVALLGLLEHLPRLRAVYFNDMSLDNVDAENLCEVLAGNKSVREVYLRNNSKITLPATRFFTRLLRGNANIVVLDLEGTRLGHTVVKKLEEDARKNAAKRGADQA
ncbi:uncharacterized protein Tco025E_02821 [Trypanosoma conorhini]|uniref:Uncharacterized protein n=1 Tax=Trypanosoma conorhini TaxID=83891 RepID=A0A422Q132_9TRYP|nr:uncharacterized protein Tco025E_02821 [Trypanosoma conorhini]RNF23407.1 hypothetical protein Tco025E_02821 [Trypanosoma conorhini]